MSSVTATTKNQKASKIKNALYHSMQIYSLDKLCFFFYYKAGGVQPHCLDLIRGLAFLPIVMFGKLL